MVAAFRGALAKLGWTEGSNLLIEYHWGGGDADKMRRQAAQLATLAPDVIFVSGGLGLERLLQVTRAVPIVFAIVPDPLGSGFVESLSRPGGNVTGFMMFEYSLSGKWLELLKQIAPGVKPISLSASSAAEIKNQTVKECGSSPSSPQWRTTTLRVTISMSARSNATGLPTTQISLMNRSATIQIATRKGTDTNSPNTRAALGNHHAIR
jgi:ABC-type uncharacterized transport system substrate-binding protein